ncbi:LMBR1 domain-containing protein 2 [Wickerhamomyces ciferrii]|uniref:LMBR1 domain-containing protein 2 n=1 Tax=Wickerhamomyces ciferrii (strain ATCC 14091 / BCRC 22168 / CBS 111 / JCM 3599 / NBRC 0793 / NRRL Y-1031 F-60-10) TaxID=1206466 RepID=K0KXM8_WICCF|nr:LMBR1 domain-containing protein 2 [Wickerhamomyces ciferrii]CCH46782.1 LMBR1 domain-containing protein 2 [Wickerhamomyces ciferrii]
MILPTIIFFTLSLLLSVLALNRFLSFKNQPNILFAIVVISAIYIPISITFLLPIDILSSNDDGTGHGDNKHNVFYLDSKYILFLWKLDYWSAFLFMWVLLPFLQEYYRSGQFNSISKAKDSFISNLKFQLAVGGIGIIGLVYFFMRFGFNFQIFKSLLIALSHTYSLILSLWLMSHGLINIPRRRWNNNINLNNQLENLYLSLPKTYDELNESNYNFKDVCATIDKISSLPGIHQSIWLNEINILKNQIPSDLNIRNHVINENFTDINQINLSILSKLNSKLKKETTNYEASKYEFNKKKFEILKLQDILESKETKTLKFRYNSTGLNLSHNGRLNYLIYVYFIPIINILISIFLFLLSIIIIESELLHSTKLSIVDFLLSSTKISSTWKFIISIILLTYMAMSALVSLTRINIFKIYHLFPKNSNPVSIVFFTMYANRLTIPLSFNFLTLLRTGKIHSNFDNFLGKSINLSILGGFLNDNLPRLIIIPILLTFFNVFDKLKQKLTFGYFDDYLNIDEDESRDQLNSGDIENGYLRKENVIKEAKSIILREVGTMNTTRYQDSSSRNSRSSLHLDQNESSSRPSYEQDSSIFDRLKQNVNFDNVKKFNIFGDRSKTNRLDEDVL